jgi:flagellar motility protein MotE (MotC chaperone)
MRIRLMPAVMIAAGALLALKVVGLATHSSILFVPSAHAEDAKPPAPAPAPAPAEAKPALPPDNGVRKVSTERVENPPVASPPAQSILTEPVSSQPALVEALSKRREQLDSRSAEIDLRENLLKAAEKRLDDRLQELKRIEETIASEDKKRTDEEQARYKDLVTMYENMKVKQAAAIFEKLDPRVLLEVAAMMKPSKLSDILGAMAPEAAQRLTVSLARRDIGPSPAALAATELPKIGARPAAQ